METPQHLAIIMDGNGRWAEQRGLPRIAGHSQGVSTVREIVRECRSLGISYLTLYAFSSENWNRPGDEVQALMGLLVTFLQQELPTLREKGIALRVIGELERLPQHAREVLQQTLKETAHHRDMVLTLALSYGARNEILRAARSLCREAAAGRIDPEALDEQMLAARLDTASLPDPDLLIRTSGEMRISNFLLWQIAYAELYFTPVLWPDFSREELHLALEEYRRRERRYGLTGAQVKGAEATERERDH